MKFLTTITTLLLTVGCLHAQVSNVRVQQRTDGNFMVDIYFDFINPDGYEARFLGIEASNDNGTTWDLECSSITGDVGEDITAGTDYHIVWDFYADNPGISGSQFKVRVLYSFFSTMTGNDGTVYKTVKIGSQWWMAENLRETKYRDGSDVVEVTSSSIWEISYFDEQPYRCVYENNENYAASYGYLYNWFVVDPAKSHNIAPTGWHVSTHDDWKELEMFLGMTPDDADLVGYRGDYQGYRLKTTVGWYSGGNGNNKSGFAAKPGGHRSKDGIFMTEKTHAYFWTSTPAVEYLQGFTYFRIIDYNNERKGIWNVLGERYMGLSIRLVKD